MKSSAELTKELTNGIEAIRETIATNILDSDFFSLSNPFFTTFISGLIVIETLRIIQDYLDTGRINIKRVAWMLVASIVTMSSLGGTVNVERYFPLKSVLPSKYHYEGKENFVRHSYMGVKYLFDSLAGAAFPDVDDLNQNFIDQQDRTLMTKALCDEAPVNQLECVQGKSKYGKELKGLPIVDLRERYYSVECGGTFSIESVCKAEIWVLRNFGTVEGITRLFIIIMGYIKAVFVVLMMSSITITVLIAFFICTSIIMFSIYEKTRPKVFSALKFTISTASYGFVIKMINYLIFEVSMGVAKYADGGEPTFSSIFVAALLVFMVSALELGLIWKIPQINSVIWSFSFEQLAQIGDGVKSAAKTMFSLTGGAVMGAGALGLGASLLKSEGMRNMRSKLSWGNNTPSAPGGGSTPGSNFSPGFDPNSIGKQPVEEKPQSNYSQTDSLPPKSEEKSPTGTQEVKGSVDNTPKASPKRYHNNDGKTSMDVLNESQKENESIQEEENTTTPNQGELDEFNTNEGINKSSGINKIKEIASVAGKKTANVAKVGAKVAGKAVTAPVKLGMGLTAATTPLAFGAAKTLGKLGVKALTSDGEAIVNEFNSWTSQRLKDVKSQRHESLYGSSKAPSGLPTRPTIQGAEEHVSKLVGKKQVESQRFTDEKEIESIESALSIPQGEEGYISEPERSALFDQAQEARERIQKEELKTQDIDQQLENDLFVEELGKIEASKRITKKSVLSILDLEESGQLTETDKVKIASIREKFSVKFNSIENNTDKVFEKLSAKLDGDKFKNKNITNEQATGFLLASKNLKRSQAEAIQKKVNKLINRRKFKK